MRNKKQLTYGRKPVLMIDPTTRKTVRRFASMSEAIDAMDPKTYMIRLAIKTGELFQDHYWELEKKEDAAREQ